MLKASEYRKHAEECRQLAAGMDAQQLDQIQEMARTWEQLAAERSEWVHRYPELAMPGEYEEEVTAAPSAGPTQQEPR